MKRLCAIFLAAIVVFGCLMTACSAKEEAETSSVVSVEEEASSEEISSAIESVPDVSSQEESPDSDSSSGIDQGTQDLSQLLEPRTEDGHYVFNPYTLSKESIDFMGEDFVAFYVDFINAYLNYETSVPCPDEYYAKTLSFIYADDFPPAMIDLDFNAFTDYDYENCILTWRYTLSKEEHDQLISDFMAEANGFLEQVTPEMSDVEKAKVIYHAFCTQMTYNYDSVDTRYHVEPYYAYVEHSGVCYTFATAYSQLLTRVGITANTIVSGTHDGTYDTVAHVWNAVGFNGEYYFCDPTYELDIQDGQGYTYFGFTPEEYDHCEYYDIIYIGMYEPHTLDEFPMAQQNIFENS